MKNSILFKGPVVWNLILFVISSLAFLYFQKLYFDTHTITDFSNLKVFVVENVYLVAFYGLTMLSIYKLSRLSKLLFISSVFVTLTISVYNLQFEFSKFNLVLIFFYIIIGFYLYQFYIYDRVESFYIPGFTHNDLFMSGLPKIEVVGHQKGIKCLTGHLTNWSSEGCYIKAQVDPKLKGIIEISFKFEEKEVKFKGQIVSKLKNNTGVGLKVLWEKQETQNDHQLGWAQFYEIIDEMGYKPELLK